jgi:hypothetical protein
MAVTIKCPDCGHAEESEDGASKTCPECEGTMTAPPKKKYQAKSSSLEDEERAKKKDKRRDEDEDRPKKKAAPRDDEDEEKRPKAKKSKPRDDEDEEDEDAPKPKKKAKAASDDEDEEVDLDFPRDGKAAKQLELDPGFSDAALMRQVARELSRGEVLHFACRPSAAVARKQAMVARFVGLGLLVVAIILAVVIFVVSTIPKALLAISAFLILFGILMGILGPKSIIRQAERGWYAVTDRRAITYMANLWGKSGHAKSYEPAALRKMWVKKSFWVTGAGDLVFHTEIHDNRTKWVDRRTGRTVKQTGSRTEHHYGFLGIEDVKDVETLVHEVLLSSGRSGDEEDEDGDEDETPKKKSRPRDDDDE